MGLICALKLQPFQALAHGQVKHEIQAHGLSSRNALCSKLGIIYRSFLAALTLETFHHQLLKYLLPLNIFLTLCQAQVHLKNYCLQVCIRPVCINTTSQNLTKGSCIRTCVKIQLSLNYSLHIRRDPNRISPIHATIYYPQHFLEIQPFLLSHE